MSLKGLSDVTYEIICYIGAGKGKSGRRTMEKRYNFRIYPTKKQEIQIQKNFGCARFAYNHYLQKRIEAHKGGHGLLSHNECCRDLTTLKRLEGFGWLRDADSDSLHFALRDLDSAFMAFFRKVKQGGVHPGFPKFKTKRETRQSYRSKNKTERQSIEISGRKIKLPKLGQVECRVSKQIEGRILSATVIQSPSGKYHVSVCCTGVEPQPLPKTGATVGLHMGVRSLATTSDGRQFENPRAFEKARKKTARLQREMSRKPKGSKNREKARVKLARAYEKAANQKKDYLQKLTTQLVREYDSICVRDEALTQIAKNPLYAKYVSDAGWGEFFRQLEYKCDWYGKELIKISGQHPSAQLCSACGARNPKPPAPREWTCQVCGARHNRAVNAAANILQEGMRGA